MTNDNKNSIIIHDSDKIIPLATSNDDFSIELPIEIWSIIIRAGVFSDYYCEFIFKDK